MEKSLKNVLVMVVDDNEDTCDLLRAVLEQAGAGVVVAQSMETAILTFRQSPPHAVIADIRLGNQDGYELLKVIRDYNREYRGFTPTVAITGFASPEDRDRALTAGFNAYLAKPFDPADVVSIVHDALHGKINRAA